MSISLITLCSFVFLVCLVTGINTTNLYGRRKQPSASNEQPLVKTISRACCASQTPQPPKTLAKDEKKEKQPLSSSSTSSSSSSSGKGSTITQKCTCISSLENQLQEFKQGFDNTTRKIEEFFNAIVGSRQDIADNFERINTVLNFLLQDYVSSKDGNKKKLVLFKLIEKLAAPALAPKRLDQERSRSEKSQTDETEESEPTANTTNINAGQVANVPKPDKKSIFPRTYNTGDNLELVFSDIPSGTNSLSSSQSASTSSLHRSSGTLNLKFESLRDLNQEATRKKKNYSSSRSTQNLFNDNNSSSATKESTETIKTASMSSVRESSENSGSGGSKDSILN